MDPTAEDVKQLGGNITLTGFRELDGGSMIILKKIIGSYARKFSELCTNFERLQVTMKTIHETEASKKFELHGMVVDNGKSHTSEMVDRNLFFAIDKILKNIETSVKKG